MRPSDLNLLLINPWIYDFTAYDLWSQPLGLLYIAAFLRKTGFNVSWINCLRSEDDDKDIPPRRYGAGNYLREPVERPAILSHIPRTYARYGIPESEFIQRLKQIKPPDAILVTSMMTYWYPGPAHVVQLLRKYFPGVPVILGGVYASLLPDHARKVVKPDLLIEGPGEIRVCEKLMDLFPIEPETDYQRWKLDDYPYPAFDLIPSLRYLCVLTARACPYDCSFCAQKLISGQFRQRDPNGVIDELSYHYRQYRLRDVAFYDDALFIKKEKHIKKILTGIIDNRLPFRFHTPNGLFAREIDQELADLMYKTNFKTIRLSFETSNEKRQADMSNKISNAAMENAVKYLTKAGFRPSDLEAYVIMGLPGQNLQEILESIIYINNLGVRVSLASFSPIPGTKDFQRAVALGLIDEHIDPLLTNKTIFPLSNKEIDYDTFRKIRIFSQVLNEAASKNLAPFGSNLIGKNLRQLLK